jgi:parallel beta-helix repeat protein
MLRLAVFLGGLLSSLVYGGSAFARTWVVDQASAEASDAGPGTPERPFRSIGPAAAAAQPGDTVLVLPGIYRERIAPARGGELGRPIIYRASHRGTAIVRGSEVFSPRWKVVNGTRNVYQGRIDGAIFAGGASPFERGVFFDPRNPSARVRPATGELKEVLGDVFVDGRPYVQVTRDDALTVRQQTWMVRAESGSILIHFPPDRKPEQCQVETTVRDRIFAPHRRGLGYIEVRGFVFEHCANPAPFPQIGAVSTRSGHAWVIEQNVIRFAATIGLDCGGEYWEGADIPDTVPEDRQLIIGGAHVIRDNDVTDNGLCGIAGWTSRDSRITNNRVERNGRRPFPGLEEWAGIKLHNTNSLIHANVIRDNQAFGIWLDNGYGDAHVDGNVLLRNRGAGVFLELGAQPGHPCFITNNVIGNTVAYDFYPGSGIYTHDASDAVVANNLSFGNAGFGVLMRTITDRQAGGKLVETSRNRILNNLLVGNAAGAISLPYPNERSNGLASDRNVFWANGPGKGPEFVINCNQDRFRLDDVAAELRRKLEASGTSGADPPDPPNWAKDPKLTLAQWRLLMRMDLKSVRAQLSVSCDDRTLPAKLRIVADARIFEMSNLPVEGLAADFVGRTIPRSGGLPGPFQGLLRGTNSLTLDTGR